MPKVLLSSSALQGEVGIRSRASMKEGDLLRGYVYDVIGSEVVENAADRMQEELRLAVIRD
jgi:hypothetical protein